MPEETSPRFALLDTVVLLRDIPSEGLRAGDLGAVVEVYGTTAVDVEFATADGRPQALLTLDVDELRPVADSDLLTVRSAVPRRGS